MGTNSGVAPGSVQRLTVVLLGGMMTLVLALGTLGVASGGVPPWIVVGLLAASIAVGLAGLYGPSVLDHGR